MKRPARAFSLLELLLVLTLLSTLFTIVAVALAGLARADRTSRERLDRERSLRQFVRQLRHDIHEAATCTISARDLPTQAAGDEVDADTDVAADTNADGSTPGPRLVLTCSNGRTIRYQPTRHGMLRIAVRDDAAPQRESYAWGADARAEWTMDETQTLPMVSLTLVIASEPRRPEQRHVIRTTLLQTQTQQTME